MQGGAVKDADQLARYVEDLLRGGMSRREVLAVKSANRAGAAGILDAAIGVDRELDSAKLGRESRLASCQMGRQVMKVASDQLRGKTVLRAYRDAVEEGRTPGHLAVSIGLTLGACGWNEQETAAAFYTRQLLGSCRRRCGSVPSASAKRSVCSESGFR